MKEHAIGEKFTHEGQTYIVAEPADSKKPCEGCAFIKMECQHILECDMHTRTDQKDVIAKPIEP